VALTRAQLHSLSTSSGSISIHPPPYIRSQHTSINASSMITSVLITGSVSHPNGGKEFCVFFFNLRVISACCSGQDETEFTRGMLNCSVVLSGSSVRVDPVDEKSVKVSVVRFAARDCNTVCEH